MPVANKPHFQLIGGVFKLLFIGPGAGVAGNDMAMADECCCDWNGSRPGYAIYARDCCTGEINPDLFLDLTRPPTHAFTKRFYDAVESTCIRFDPSDVATAILMSDPGFTGTRDFLASGLYSWDRYSTCTTCRCDHSLGPCCYDYINYPTLASYLRVGQWYYSFSGLSVLADVLACHPTIYMEDDGLTQTYQQVTKLIIPTGPYTETCDPTIAPDTEVIVTYYHGPGCGTLSDNRLPATDHMSVAYNIIILPSILYYSGSPYTNMNLFDSFFGYTTPTPSATEWIACDGTQTFPDDGYAGTRPTAGGGSVTLYPCCPSEPGGV